MDLITASRDGKIDVVQQLLDSGTDVNYADNKGYTALILASRKGHINVINLLLDRGGEAINVNRANNDGGTALILATRFGRTDAVRILFDRGADINLADNYGYTALIVASNYGHIDIVRLLLSTDSVDISHKNKYGKTALMLAQQHRYDDIIADLTRYEEEVNRIRVNLRRTYNIELAYVTPNRYKQFLQLLMIFKRKDIPMDKVILQKIAEFIFTP